MGCDLISNAEDMRFIETRRLFRHAFDTYSFVQVLANTTMLGQPEVKNAKGRENVVVHAKDDAIVLLPKEYNKDDILIKLTYQGELTAPLKAGETVGSVSIVYQGVELAVSDLVTLTKVEAQDNAKPQSTKDDPTSDNTEEEPKSVVKTVILTLLIIALIVGGLFLGAVYAINTYRAKRRAAMRRQRQQRRRYYDE